MLGTATQRGWEWFGSRGFIGPDGLVNDGITLACRIEVSLGRFVGVSGGVCEEFGAALGVVLRVVVGGDNACNRL